MRKPKFEVGDPVRVCQGFLFDNTRYNKVGITVAVLTTDKPEYFVCFPGDGTTGVRFKEADLEKTSP